MESKTKRITGPSLIKFFSKTSMFAAFHFHDLMTEYGDVVKCGPYFYLVNNPDVAKHILNRDQKDFNQEDFIGKRTKTVFGLGMVTSQGDMWASERKLLNPVFHSKNIHKYISETLDEIDRQLDNWKPIAKSNDTFDIADKMGDISIMTSGRLLFDTDFSNKIVEIKDVVEIGTKYIADGVPFFIPYWIPTPSHIKLKKISKQIDVILNSIINERANSHANRDDLADTLIKALGKPESIAEDRRLMLDEMKTMLAGGYFPISCSLSMFWYAMGQNPNYFAKIKEEVRNLPKDYKFNIEFYQDFPKITSAILETMRLYPVAFSIWRKSIKKCNILGFDIPKGKTICISLFNVHRNPEFWNEPNKFKPERFNKLNSKNRPKHHFMPFGWGNRKCIGDHYAMMVIFLTIIKTLMRFDVEIVPTEKLEVKTAALLCPKKVDARIL